MRHWMLALATPLLLVGGGPAGAAVLGEDAAACASGQGPAIEVTVIGLKDRKGEVKLELYPATDADFLKDDRDLIRQGKTFRRVRAPTPQAGGVTMCIRVPQPGRYALLFTHNRDGKNKFGIWSDGVGFVGGRKLGRSKPTVGEATVNAGAGVTTVSMRVQYLRGFGFAPID